MNRKHKDRKKILGFLMLITLVIVVILLAINIFEYFSNILHTDAYEFSSITTIAETSTTEPKTEAFTTEHKVKTSTTEPKTEASTTELKKVTQTIKSETTTFTTKVTTVTQSKKSITKKVAEKSEWNGEILNTFNGTVEGPSGKETFYNLDMSLLVSEMRNMGYNYEYWVRDDGVKMFGKYVMCAANNNLRPKGTILETSLGTAIVCDTGSFATTNPTQIDIAVTW